MNPVTPCEAAMQSHWTEHRELLRARLKRIPRFLVASDYDGTLSPLVDHPGEAAPHPAAVAVLRDLADLHPRVRLAILSGRAVDDLAARLGVAPGSMLLSGNHGLELRGAGLDWTHPVVAGARPQLETLAAQLRHAVGEIPGAEVEDKGLSLTVHYRRIDPADLPAFRAALEQVALPDCIQERPGKMVVEFRPRVEWNKGRAFRRILRRLGIPSSAAVYLGDDVTDEDVFHELKDTGITVHIGPPSAGNPAALHAHDIPDAIQFLRMVIGALS